MNGKIRFYLKHHAYLVTLVSYGVILLLLISVHVWQVSKFHQESLIQSATTTKIQKQKVSIGKQLASVQKDLHNLQNQDQVKINKQLQDEINHIHDTYKQSITTYEKLLNLKQQSTKTNDFDAVFAQAIAYLADKNYASAEATLTGLNNDIQAQLDKIAAASVPQAAAPPVNAPANNTAPGNGFSRQQVTTDVGTFSVDIIAADLNSNRVIVDTASDSDCHDNCPVLPLDAYVSRSGAWAGINGSFFCPASYPSCAGKTNSFDTLLMNKNKHYFNSDNNVYSTVPAVIFSGNSARLVGRSLEWGRDTGVDAVIAMQPLLLSGGNVAYSDSPDPKFNSKGSRGFIGASGSTAYIGDVYNATMGESAHVLKTLGIQNAINLDEGGSTALWNGGYKIGPGRNIPNAVLFVHK